MSAVYITNVTVLDNPASFLAPFQFEISYECVASLKDDLEWKLTYVGSAEDETYDQLLESVLVGPVNVGNYRFVLQADPPDPSKIREEDIIGVTVLLLTCSYMGQEFVRVGYYVNNDYDDEQLREEPPHKVSSLYFLLSTSQTFALARGAATPAPPGTKNSIKKNAAALFVIAPWFRGVLQSRATTPRLNYRRKWQNRPVS